MTTQAVGVVMAQPLSAILVYYMFHSESELTQWPGYSASGLSYMRPMSNNEDKKLEHSSILIYFCAALFELENLESV